MTRNEIYKSQRHQHLCRTVIEVVSVRFVMLDRPHVTVMPGNVTCSMKSVIIYTLTINRSNWPAL